MNEELPSELPDMEDMPKLPITPASADGEEDDYTFKQWEKMNRLLRTPIKDFVRFFVQLFLNNFFFYHPKL